MNQQKPDQVLLFKLDDIEGGLKAVKTRKCSFGDKAKEIMDGRETIEICAAL